MNEDAEHHHDEYDDVFVAGLEWMWGEGFLSPGGRDEVAEILSGVVLDDKRVLDIGCGIGGVDVLLVAEFGAEHVTGIDVETPLLAKAAQTAQRAGVVERVAFELVTPGRLPFDDGCFDVVFSKDSMIHIPDKVQIYTEIKRVLKPGGRLAFSDWFGSTQPDTAEFLAWLDIVGLTFNLGTLDDAAALLAELGFVAIQTNDRNAWYGAYMERELATMLGENFEKLVIHLGREAAEHRLKSSSLKKQVVDQGLLRPGHIRAVRP
ncbi:MAG: methyltransferase domain-containing protein [Gammaproteobacteria bacterium]|nr:methyltransferase domain-containing protein [Gammaproteobacteria bacterium]